MRRRPFASIASSVSVIGLGTSQLANTDGNKVGIRPVSKQAADLIFRTAIDAGIDFIETGDLYGRAEELIGALAPRLRHSVIVATKAGLREDGTRDFSPVYLRSRVERSLSRLKTDRLDLFQLCKPTAQDWAGGGLKRLLSDLKSEGKIRAAGVIVGSLEDGRVALENDIDAIQVLYHMLYPSHAPLMAAASERRVAVMVRSPLNSGLLSGTHTANTVWPAHDERARYFSGEDFRIRMRALEGIRKALDIPSGSLLEFAIRFAMSGPGVCVVIPGASTPEQAKRYAACGNLPHLPGGDIECINAIIATLMTGHAGPFQLN